MLSVRLQPEHTSSHVRVSTTTLSVNEYVVVLRQIARTVTLYRAPTLSTLASMDSVGEEDDCTRVALGVEGVYAGAVMPPSRSAEVTTHSYVTGAKPGY